MKVLIFLLGLINLVLSNTLPEARLFTICYGEHGCFTTNAPFTDLFVRPICFLPQSPDKVATKFYLYTRDSPNTPVLINYKTLSESFKANRQTRFIVHGFLHHGFKHWIIDMKDALLRVEDSNIIVVDWSKGNQFPYTQATANTQIVGADIALLVKFYISNGLLTADDVHIIGHSLGSHIAGYAGERIYPRIGRITGLDPAGPYFENGDVRVRLDPSDAKFVDAIHTDGKNIIELGLGLMQKVGHVDFYPNGGNDQPNCPQTSGKLIGAVTGIANFDIEGIEDAVSCSHMAAVHFYTNSIQSGFCNYPAYKCSSLSDFRNGKCVSCSAAGCNHMGHWASPDNELGALYLTTQDATRSPYCLNHFGIKAISNTLTGMGSTRGRFTISLKGTKRQSSAFIIDNADTKLNTGSALQKIGESASEIGSITGATLSFTRAECLLCGLLDNKWSFKSIEVVDAQSQTTVKLCPTQTWISSGSSLEFTLC